MAERFGMVLLGGGRVDRPDAQVVDGSGEAGVELVGGGDLRVLGGAQAQHRVGADELADQFGGDVGLADVHALHAGARGAGGQVHVDAVVDQQVGPSLGVHGGLADHLQEFGRRHVLATQLDRLDAAGDRGRNDFIQGPAGGRGRIGNQVDAEIPHQESTAFSMSSCGPTRDNASRKFTAKEPGPLLSSSARSAAAE